MVQHIWMWIQELVKHQKYKEIQRKEDDCGEMSSHTSGLHHWMVFVGRLAVSQSLQPTKMPWFCALDEEVGLLK